MGSLLATVTEWMRVGISNWGYVGIFVMMAIGSACVPLPSEIVMVYGGYLAVSQPERFGSMGILWMGIIGALGCVFGSAIAYWVGKYGGRPFINKYGKYFLVREKDLDKADVWFVKHGIAAIFFGRMLPVVRAYISFPAGIAEMPFWRFNIYTFIGSLPWCIGLAYVGKVVAGNMDVLKPYFHKADALIVGAAFVLVALYIYHHIKSERDYRKAKGNRPDSDSETIVRTRKPNMAEEIEKLAQLNLAGMLSDEEMSRAKEVYLGRPVSQQDEAVQLLRNLHDLYVAGALSESEFNMKKWEILSSRKLK